MKKKQLVVKNGIDNLIDTLDEELQATDLCSPWRGTGC